MSITVYVENMNHGRVRHYHDANGKLGELAEVGKASRSALGAVYRHGDAMLNTPQLWWLLDEIGAIERRTLSPSAREALDALGSAAQEAIRLGGYLFFSGD